MTKALRSPKPAKPAELATTTTTTAKPPGLPRRRAKIVSANPAYDPTAAVADLILATPIGPLRLVADDRSLWAIYFPNHPDGALLRPTGEPAPAKPQPRKPAASSHPILREAARQLDEYFAGARRDFDLPLATGGTEFQQQVWRQLCTIPFAATWSYGELATRVGNRNASRAVGAANGMNPIPIIVPCHRVIGSNGSLTGFGGGEPTKRWLLDHEAKVAGLRLL